MTTKDAEVPEKYAQGWLDNLDGRYGLARELRQRFAMVCDDLGGVDSLSYYQRSLVERSLWLEYFLTRQEHDLMQGENFDAGKWIQGCNSLQGIATRLGLHRKARDVPTLASYLASKAAAQ